MVAVLLPAVHPALAVVAAVVLPLTAPVAAVVVASLLHLVARSAPEVALPIPVLVRLDLDLALPTPSVAGYRPVPVVVVARSTLLPAVRSAHRRSYPASAALLVPHSVSSPRSAPVPNPLGVPAALPRQSATPSVLPVLLLAVLCLLSVASCRSAAYFPTSLVALPLMPVHSVFPHPTLVVLLHLVACRSPRSYASAPVAAPFPA
jgi:hypothetical protein